jgi:hypothetical protein
MAFCFSVYPISLHKTSKHAHDPINTKKKKQTEGQKIFFRYVLLFMFNFLLVDYLGGFVGLDLFHLFLNALV